MEKRVIRKEDGRYLIFYAFERPLPKVDEGKAAPAGDAGVRPDDAVSKGGDA